VTWKPYLKSKRTATHCQSRCLTTLANTHPESEQWNDPDWRAEWLDGLTDDELNEMTPREKGQRLKAYAFGRG